MGDHDGDTAGLNTSLAYHGAPWVGQQIVSLAYLHKLHPVCLCHSCAGSLNNERQLLLIQQQNTVTRDLKWVDSLARRGSGLRRAEALAAELSYHATRHFCGPRRHLAEHHKHAM